MEYVVLYLRCRRQAGDRYIEETGCYKWEAEDWVQMFILRGPKSFICGA